MSLTQSQHEVQDSLKDMILESEVLFGQIMVECSNSPKSQLSCVSVGNGLPIMHLVTWVEFPCLGMLQ